MKTKFFTKGPAGCSRLSRGSKPYQPAGKNLQPTTSNWGWDWKFGMGFGVVVGIRVLYFQKNVSCADRSGSY